MALTSISSFGGRPSAFGEFQGDGYYWYKQDPDPEPEKEKPKPPPPAPAPPPSKVVKPLSAEWFRQNLPKLLDAATDNPTPENVANYMYAQRVVLDKSQTFSNVAKQVVGLDPFLDENNRVPLSQFANASFMRDLDRSKEEALKYMGERSGLWVFIDNPNKCSACDHYVKEVVIGNSLNKGVATANGFRLRVINVNTPEGMAATKKLKLTVTPTTVLVVPPNGYYLISQGLMARTSLSERILLAARTKGHLPTSMVESVTPFDKGLLTQEQINSAVSNDDPQVVMKNLIDKIRGSK